MRKILFIIAVMSTASYTTGSFLHRTQIGNGYQIFYGLFKGDLVAVPVGTYADYYRDLRLQRTYNKEQNNVISEYINQWNKFKKSLPLYQEVEL